MPCAVIDGHGAARSGIGSQVEAQGAAAFDEQLRAPVGGAVAEADDLAPRRLGGVDPGLVGEVAGTGGQRRGAGDGDDVVDPVELQPAL